MSEFVYCVKVTCDHLPAAGVTAFYKARGVEELRRMAFRDPDFNVSEQDQSFAIRVIHCFRAEGDILYPLWGVWLDGNPDDGIALTAPAGVADLLDGDL